MTAGFTRRFIESKEVRPLEIIFSLDNRPQFEMIKFYNSVAFLRFTAGPKQCPLPDCVERTTCARVILSLHVPEKSQVEDKEYIENFVITLLCTHRIFYGKQTRKILVITISTFPNFF